MKAGLWAVGIISFTLVACGNEHEKKVVIDPQNYQVQNSAALQQRVDALNLQLATNFKKFKQVENLSFSDQTELDVNNLHTLNLHLVASTALKPSKQAYCDLMNQHFAELYHLGHSNLTLLDQIKLPNASNETLSKHFQDVDSYYNFIMNKYTSYRQVQQVMKYGCHLKAAL